MARAYLLASPWNSTDWKCSLAFAEQVRLAQPLFTLHAIEARVRCFSRAKSDSIVFESRISSGGRTTLPKAVRNALGVQAGDRVRYVVQDGEVRIVKLLPVSRLNGALRHGGATMALAE